MDGNTTKNTAGYQFLCDILGIAHQPSQMKDTLLQRAKSGSPLRKDETQTIQTEFTEMIHDVKKYRRELLEDLDELLNTHYPNAGTHDFFAYPEGMDNMYTGLFQKQSGTTNLHGIAMTLVLSTGYESPSFYIGASEARAILTKSMECLGYANADFIPDSCFAITENGCMDIHTSWLMLLSLYGALKFKYPHKANDKKQREKNLEKARGSIEALIESNRDVPIFSALRNSAEISRICQGMMDALRESTEQECFPNGLMLPLIGFYSIPAFETSGRSVTQILRRDYNSFVRSLVIGKSGSGKSMLVKAIARTCLEPAELREGNYKNYADALGLQDNQYFPLILNCRELLSDIRDLDIIAEAVHQLARLTNTSSHHACLTHWADFSQQIIDYYKQRAKNSTLLLIIEDLSCFDRSTGDLFLQKLHHIEQTEYPHIHILVVSQQLLNSQMVRFRAYNQAEIIPLNHSLEREIRMLVSSGLGCADAEYYIRLLDVNRHARAFVDSPKHLVKMLCHPTEGNFNLNTLLLRTIDEQLDQQPCSNVTDTECREFLTALAVSVAESKKITGFSRGIYPMEYNRIPKNVVDRGCIEAVDRKISSPDAVWQHIMDNKVLICPASGINTYAFHNHSIYCSLVADHYISLFGVRRYANWLDHFNRISSEDFSVIIVLMVERLCIVPSGEITVPADIPPYEMLLLVQAVAGYILSQTGLSDIYNCLLALKDILSAEHIRESFLASRREDLWNTLVRVYDNCYGRYQNMSDDPIKLTRLTSPEQFSHH